MPKELRVAKYSEALSALVKRAQEIGVYAIGRLEDSKGFTIVVDHNELDKIDPYHTVGLGVQVFTPDGHTGFASSDNLHPASCRKLVEVAARLARNAATNGAETNRAVFEIPSNGQHIIATEAKSL